MKIKYTAVVVAALGYWVLGALWYSPLLFASRFIELMRWTPEQLAAVQAAGAGKEIAVALLNSLLIAYVLAHFVRYVGAESVPEGMKTGFWLWLGFVLTTNLDAVLFESRPLGLYLISSGFHLVGFLWMGALLTVWRRSEVRGMAYQT
ncbi:MAG: DUF1761 domain-containing protein [Acidobacteria bacterium]|nr:DUF1761 domain-containing protein [Acidobacteriota bacterium]